MTKWLRTPDAVEALGVSADFLKRHRDSHGGFFEEGKHYVLGHLWRQFDGMSMNVVIGSTTTAA